MNIITCDKIITFQNFIRSANSIMPEKSIADVIQEIFDKSGKAFATLTSLPRVKLGLKSNSPVSQVHKYLESRVEDRFMFVKNGRKIYIIKPCEPSELVLSALSKTTAKSPKVVANSLPFLKRSDLVTVLNELINNGQAKIVLTADFEPRVMLVDKTITVPVDTPAPSGNYTQQEFKKAFDELDKGKIFVRICDLRRELNWPRKVFDNMIKNLRDSEVIQLHTGDDSLMTPDEVNDCFVDENNFRMGSVTWYAR